MVLQLAGQLLLSDLFSQEHSAQGMGCTSGRDQYFLQGPIYWKISPPWGGEKNISRCHLGEKL
jgi:hypothetical protein